MLKGDNQFDSRNLSNILRHTHTQKPAYNYSSILGVKDRKFKCLPTGEQINITWYTHTMKYYSATKKGRNTNICYNTEALLDCAKLKLNRCWSIIPCGWGLQLNTKVFKGIWGGYGNVLKLDYAEGGTTLKIYHESLNCVLSINEFYGM